MGVIFTCVICWYPEVPFDDAIAPSKSGRCICLRCYQREVGDRRPRLAPWYESAIRAAAAV